jgi:Family of unknown function (DUF6526)
MSDQNLNNHSRFVPAWHFFGSAVLAAILIGSIIHLVNSPKQNFSAWLPLLVAIFLGLLFWYSRAFALKAQDRAIRAEENFRHFILTGHPFDKSIGMGQIIALRFASDDELAMLAKRAVAEKLSPRQIKEAIRNWRPDNYRL